MAAMLRFSVWSTFAVLVLSLFGLRPALAQGGPPPSNRSVVTMRGGGVTDEQGSYIFAGLPLGHDYKVWADMDGTTSPVKLVSSFLETRDITIHLRLTEKKAQEAPTAAKSSTSK